ncbi:sialate O-acetylesterase [Pedobacter fastidiosus]|uniref:9-O-acetylesterase n=1 Tax=Pedobacter fastidiosus TaxID=2765361 RepID=A0ABR7KR22_9SPHI|nr:sialate O-acetylesterase [Pedobacter fastidiosus]MBC6110491.1 9-O-acetylesterase [Pedobacter fastidiosus]
MSNFKFRLLICVIIFISSLQLVQAKVILPSVFSDNMVLQQKTNAAIWGWADAGKKINITTSWNSKQYSTTADEKGNWKIKVATPVFGGPYSLSISDGEELKLNNVLIGDVWICSGQSNMEMPLAGWGRIQNYEKEIADANYPNIRLLQADHITSNTPLDNAKVQNGGWQACSPQYIAEFSSTAYFFAREVYNKTKIPIGLIHTSWGGTIAEAWTSGESLKKMPDFAPAVEKIGASTKTTSGVPYEQKLQNWMKMVADKDLGAQSGKSWVLTDASEWQTMKVPTLWEDAGLKDFDGIVWFTKKVSLPESWVGKDVKLNLGLIDDNDITYLNGTKVGETQGYNQARKYSIPNNLLKAGENTITVKVFDNAGGGGLYGDAKDMNLVSSSNESISLAGDWKYKVGLNFKDVEPAPASDNNPNRPTVLYNAMIHPFLQFSIKGAIWYQGESNADRAYQYRELFPTMIKDWRQKFGQGNFPFYFVQLANFMKKEDQPVESAWAELREAQLQTISLPNTGMATIIDIGDAKDIHPKNKQEVGRRLGLIADANVYGQKVIFSGPLYKAQKVEGNQIKLSFEYADGLKSVDGNELKGFAIAGADKKFYWAKATVKGNQILVSSDQVTNPVSVRYAWENNPEANLTNASNLPASPFRTDVWEGVTFNKK